MWLYPIVKKYVKNGDRLYPLGEEVTKKGDKAYKVKKEFAKVESYPPEDFFEWEDTTITGFSEKGQSIAEEILGIVFPQKCTEIKAQAFVSGKGFSFFNTAIITENIKNVGTAVFNGVTGLKRVYVTEEGEDLSFDSAVFSGCNIESFNISKRIVKLGGASFASCSSLKTITSSEREKGLCLEYPFAGCQGLETANIKGLEKVSLSYIFQACNSLKKIELSLIDNAVFDNAIWYSCNNVEEVIINGNITTTKAIFNGSTTTNDGFDVIVNGDWLEIPQYCFTGGSLKKITINGEVNVIGAWSFANCLKITEFKIPETVTKIDTGAFAGCENATIYVPKKFEGKFNAESRVFENVKNVIYYKEE